MLFGPDWLTNIFIFLFFFGLIFTVASLLLGFTHIGGDIHGNGAGGHSIDVQVDGHHIHVDTPGDASGHDGPGVLNLPTIMAFITWLGGAGYLFRHSAGLNGYVATFLAVVSGLIGGAIMFVLLARVLWPMMSKPMNSADYSRPGTPARVVSSIREGGVGEIVYSKSGSRFTCGARSEDGRAIPKGAEVVILRYQRGIAYVQDVETLLEGVSEEEHAASAT